MMLNYPNIVHANTAAIDKAVGLLREGRLVAFPTETVYGLGADAAQSDAVRRIFTAKGRPADHPLIVHVPQIASIDDWAQCIPDSARVLTARFWPGPLAIILNKKITVPPEVTGGQSTVALRMPCHPVAQALLTAFGGGVAAPSANRFCRISPTLACHVAEELGDEVDLILDGGACQIGVESTIIDLSGPHPHVLRPGHISVADLEVVLGEKVLVSAPTQVRASGMMAVHYAPVTPSLLCSSLYLFRHYCDYQASNKKVGLMVYKFLPDVPTESQIVMPKNAEGYAQALYATLRKLDSIGLDVILIESPPEEDDWHAVHDRLAKAAVRI